MSPSSKVIYLENRSAAETDDKCGMAYWWSQLEGQTRTETGGIVPNVEADALMVGREIHEDMQALATMEDLSPYHLERLLEEIVHSVPTTDRESLSKMEKLYRRLGWIAAWGLYMEPIVRETWDNVAVEGELILDRDPLWVPVTPDRVLRHKKHKYLSYMEFKSTISASNKWMSSWKYAIQLHLGITAIEEEFVRSGREEKIAYAQIVGLMKGEVRTGKLSHPYVWAYRNNSNGEWTHEYQKARGAQWEACPVWEYEGGIVKWVQRLGKEVALEQFPFSSVVTLNSRMVDDWCARRLSRQMEIAEVKAACQEDWDTRVVYFEPRTRNCRPPFGDSCPYLGLCWNATIQLDPLKTGDFQRRKPHHEVEVLFTGEE
jgi:hypothetical protein